MLPLHTTYRNLIPAFFLVTILTSCSDGGKKNLMIIKVLEESIATSNKILSASTNEALASLQEKLADAGSREKAQIWYPKAQMIQAISTEAYNYIEEIIEAKRFEKLFENGNFELYERLVNYRSKLLQVDPIITKRFERSLRVFTSEIDSANTNQKEKLKKYFIEASVDGGQAMLVKLQNNIKLNEERMTIFCHEQIATHPLYDVISVITVQNKSVVQSGKLIEIYAGVGEFRSEMKPEVFVYEKPVRLYKDAVAIYKLKASSKPGKHYVPVKINLTDQNGAKQSIQKEIEYTVANIQQQ